MPTVYMMLGLPGSGKTTFSKELQSQLNIPRLSVDEEYSKLGGNLPSTAWDSAISHRAGEAIKVSAVQLVKQNESVILDLCPWNKQKRAEYRHLIESIGANCHIYYFDVSKEVLMKRLNLRNKSVGDYHQVTPQMLEEYIEEFDPPENEDVEVVRLADSTTPS